MDARGLRGSGLTSSENASEPTLESSISTEKLGTTSPPPTWCCLVDCVTQQAGVELLLQLLPID